MCQELRDKHRIPDEFVKDTHVTNWFKKNLSDDVLAVFRSNEGWRSTLTKNGFGNLTEGGMIVVTNKGAINLDSCDAIFFEKVKV